jgi:hypothetical protein
MLIRPRAGQIFEPWMVGQLIDELERLAKISGDHRILVSDGPDGFNFAASTALSSGNTFVAQLFIAIQAPVLIGGLPYYPWRQKIWAPGWTDGPLSGTPVAAPGTPSLSTSPSGGTVPANTYYVVMAYNTATGPSNAGPEDSITTSGGTSTITADSPPAATGATGWLVYVGTQSGGPYYLQGGATAIGSNFTLSTPPVTNTAQAPTKNNPANELDGVYTNPVPSNLIVPAWFGDESQSHVVFQLDPCAA